MSRKSLLFCVCIKRLKQHQSSTCNKVSYRNLQDYKSVYRHKQLVRNFVTTFLRQRAALCCRELKATTSPQLRYTQEAVQPRSKFRFLCPLQGGRPLSSQRRHFDRSLATQTKLRGRGVKMFSLISSWVARGSSTSLVRSRKELLIAQEEEKGCLIWRPQWCSSLQSHGELISTWAIDRKRDMERMKRGQREGRAALSWLL